MGIYFKDILLIVISRGANNCVQSVFEKKHLFHKDISPPFCILMSNEKLDCCDLKKYIISKGLKMQINFHSLL